MSKYDRRYFSNEATTRATRPLRKGGVEFAAVRCINVTYYVRSFCSQQRVLIHRVADPHVIAQHAFALLALQCACGLF